MSRVPFYLRERLDDVKQRVLFETYEAQKLPKWEQVVLTWIVLFSFWTIISANVKVENLLIGGLATLVISLFMYEMLTEDIRRSGHILEKILYISFFVIPQYLFIMAFRLIESNFKVAKHAVFMDINPGIVKIKTELHSNTGITILANSIRRMVEEDLLVNPFGWGALVLIVTSLILSYRVLFGPTLADRIVGINTVTTKLVVILAIFGFIMEEYFFLDLAIVLLMVNAVGSLILAKYMEGAK